MEWFITLSYQPKILACISRNFQWQKVFSRISEQEDNHERNFQNFWLNVLLLGNFMIPGFAGNFPRKSAHQSSCFKIFG